ncbi:MAG TPA: sugar ABC transporter permease [Terriglobales bacterium]|nr:sugar ABC transporter permease [Terriglobales bacterium]
MRSSRTGWLLLSPTLLVLFFVGLLPFLYVLVLGFFRWNAMSAQSGAQYIGIDNYRTLVFDQDFLNSLWLTIRFSFFAVLSELVLGFLLAQLLTRDFPGKTLFRIVHTTPLMMAPLVIGAVWRLLTIPGFGIVPYYLNKWWGIDYRIGMYGDQAFITTVLMDIWHWTPFVTLTMLAGLTALPKEPLEQAQVDGANRWQTFWYITFPIMRPVILTTVFIRIMDALRTVDEVWMLTGGGTSTRYIGIHIWRVVFPKTDYGYGAAMSLLTLYFTIVVCWLLYVSIMQKRSQQRT